MPDPALRVRLTAADVLREALHGTPGWRGRARRVLGIATDRQCPVCEGWYDLHRSGTGRTCGRRSCQRAYRARRGAVADA